MTPSELEAVKGFPQAAREFCLLIESHTLYTRKQFLAEVLLRLSKLWTVGLQLPDVVPSTPDIDYTDEDVKRYLLVRL